MGTAIVCPCNGSIGPYGFNDVTKRQSAGGVEKLGNWLESGFHSKKPNINTIFLYSLYSAFIIFTYDRFMIGIDRLWNFYRQDNIRHWAKRCAVLLWSCKPQSIAASTAFQKSKQSSTSANNWLLISFTIMSPKSICTSIRIIWSCHAINLFNLHQTKLIPHIWCWIVCWARN